MKKTLFLLLFSLITLNLQAQDETPDYMSVLFKRYIINELGQMDSLEYQRLNKLELHNGFKREKESWTETVAAVLDFSETIDIAIWHLWIKNLDLTKKQNITYTAEEYANDFINAYYKEGSMVDVWSGSQLAEAKELVKHYKETHNLN